MCNIHWSQKVISIDDRNITLSYNILEVKELNDTVMGKHY